MSYRFSAPAQARESIRYRLLSHDLEFDGTRPYIHVDRERWNSKRHPGSLRAALYYPSTSQLAPLERIAEAVRTLPDVIDVEIIREPVGNNPLRPQVRVWFEAP